MDAETIRTLDGHALTQMAWQLGLAPAEVVGDREVDHAHQGEAPCVWVVDHWERWRPHIILAQADAVVRELRSKGWRVSSSSHAQGGIVYAQKRRWVRVAWGSHVPIRNLGGASLKTEPSECLALLRCPVLAVASEQEAPHG